MTANSIPLFSSKFRITKVALFGILIITALLAFEVFNYSSTDFALSDLLGELRFLGVRWSTILAIAFCGVDFAGIARLFTPEQGAEEPMEIWYLFGAWLLAATMNAMLTWWGVSLAVINHDSLGNAVIPRETLLKIVPVFVAVLVWLIRVLIIGTFSVAGDRLFSQDGQQADASIRRRGVVAPTFSTPQQRKTQPRRTYSPAPKPNRRSRPEPTYEPIAASGQSSHERIYEPIMARRQSNRTSNQF